MDLEFTRYANIRSEELLWQVFHLLKYSMIDFIQLCNDKGFMTGTFIDETLQIESLIQELVNDFSDRIPSTDIDITDYFFQLLKSYQ